MNKMLALMLLFFLNTSYAMETKFHANEEQLCTLLQLLHININAYAQLHDISITRGPSGDENFPTIFQFTASLKTKENASISEILNVFKNEAANIDRSALNYAEIGNHCSAFFPENEQFIPVDNLNLRK